MLDEQYCIEFGCQAHDNGSTVCSCPNKYAGRSTPFDYHGSMVEGTNLTVDALRKESMAALEEVASQGQREEAKNLYYSRGLPAAILH